METKACDSFILPVKLILAREPGAAMTCKPDQEAIV